MKLTVALNKKLTDDTWSAVGNFVTADGSKEGSAEVLVKEVEPNAFKLVLDSSLQVSKMMDREISLYTNVKKFTLETVKKKAVLVFDEISTTLKK